MLINVQFTAYAQRYIDTVYRVAYYDIKLPADADDVTQNVLLKLLHTQKPFESDVVMKDGSCICGRYGNGNYKLFESPVVLEYIDYALLPGCTRIKMPELPAG